LSADNSGNGQFLVENIDPMLCTHIIYAFAHLDEDTHSIYSRYSDIDLEEDGGRGNNKFKDSKYAQLSILN
jgi:chitinase